MTKSEFEKKIFELLKKYRLNDRLKDKIKPIFEVSGNLSRDERNKIYNLIEELVIAQKEVEKASKKLNRLFSDINTTLYRVRKDISQLKRKVDIVKKDILPDQFKINSYIQKPGYNKMYNKHSFHGEKPNFGLKINKLFSSYITEYGPEYVTLVISDSILYYNNLILKISLITKEVLIGSSQSIKHYQVDNKHFLITEKPEVIPYGNTIGFHFKYITYEDILNLTNGDFFKVFDSDILKHYKKHETGLPDELKKVGYYKFE